MSSEGESIVRVDNLTHRYAGADGRLALDGLTLSVRPGEIFGILGPNGSGKTTLFRILSTLIATAPGHAFVLGHDVATDRDFVRRHIGVVFQSPSLDKQLTAGENLVHQGHLYGLRGAELRARVAEGLDAVALGERAGERVGTFSGGMRRRVEVAKGLLHRPRVLLMDEPSTGIDPSARIDMWTQLRAVREAGVTVMLTTHLMEEAEHCTRLAIMAEGKLLACDTPTTLKQRIGGDVIMISSRSPEKLQEALRAQLDVKSERVGDSVRLERERGHEWVPRVIEAAPGLVESVSVGKPTLEDVFIHLTGRRLAGEAEVVREAAARGSSPPTTHGR
jgi:ABC-2 type transport system ATP-binding protein